MSTVFRGGRQQRTPGKIRRGRLADAKLREFWARVESEHPFQARSPTSVKPSLVTGDHVSAVFTTGWRTWGFRTEEARDTFVAQFGAFKTNPTVTS